MKYNPKRIDEAMAKMGYKRIGNTEPLKYTIGGVEATLKKSKLNGESLLGFQVACGELSVLEMVSDVSNRLNKNLNK